MEKIWSAEECASDLEPTQSVATFARMSRCSEPLVPRNREEKRERRKDEKTKVGKFRRDLMAGSHGRGHFQPLQCSGVLSDAATYHDPTRSGVPQNPATHDNHAITNKTRDGTPGKGRTKKIKKGTEELNHIPIGDLDLASPGRFSHSSNPPRGGLAKGAREHPARSPHPNGQSTHSPATWHGRHPGMRPASEG